MSSFKPGALYKALVELPVPTAARFLRSLPGSSLTQVEATFSISDQLRNVRQTISQSFTAVAGQETVGSAAQPLADVVLSASSTKGDLQARLRQVNGDAGKKRYIEIWRGLTLEVQKDVTEIHEEFYGDESVSGITFSPFHDAVLYTAEKKITDTSDPYAKFRYVPTFGEGYGEKKTPAFFLLRWNGQSGGESTLQRISFKDQYQALLGQPIFSPKDPEVVYATGYEYVKDGRLLGLKACTNRPSSIWEVRVPLNAPADGEVLESDGQRKRLTGTELACRSPRTVEIEGKHTLVWLANPIGGPHASSTMIQSMALPESDSEQPASVQTLVDVVQEPDEVGGFPGLYPGVALANEPFTLLSGVPHVVLHSIWESRQVILLVSLIDGKTRNLTPLNDDLYSWSLLQTDGEKNIICVRSTSSSPPELMLGEIEQESVRWTVLAKPSLSPAVDDALANITTKVVSIPGRGPTQAIVMQTPGAVDTGVAPCILNPHGGPHATITTAFSVMTACLTLDGFTTCAVNYTGSLGFGDKHVRVLQGQCGSLDVVDCYETFQYLVKEGIAQEGPGKVFVSGGSHGGFLAGHLVGQYPSLFTAAALANPVISAGEASGTDILDWYYAEFGLGDDLQTAPAFPQETYGKLQASSPIVYVDAVKADILLFVGASDRRVAPTQGINYYHALRAAGKLVEMLVFPGQGHSLEGLEETRVRYEATRDWFSSKRV